MVKKKEPTTFTKTIDTIIVVLFSIIFIKAIKHSALLMSQAQSLNDTYGIFFFLALIIIFAERIIKGISEIYLMFKGKKK